MNRPDGWGVRAAERDSPWEPCPDPPDDVVDAALAAAPWVGFGGQWSRVPVRGGVRYRVGTARGPVDVYVTSEFLKGRL